MGNKSEKILRFLNSLGVSNVDDFDVEFEMIGRNRFDNEQWDMVIVKQTPWSYDLLKSFDALLPKIKYKFTLRFSYMNRPNFKNLISLFADWYKDQFKKTHELDITGDDRDYIFIKYKGEEQKEEYRDAICKFKKLLEKYSYEFIFQEEVVEAVKEVVLSNKEMKQIEKSAANDAEESMSADEDYGPINDRNDVLDALEEQRKEMSLAIQESILDQMRENALQMKRERERARLNKRGNYSHIENIDSITPNTGSVDFNGTVFKIESKTFGNKTNLTIGVNDELGGAIFVYIMQGGQLTKEAVSNIIPGTNIRVRGVSYLDPRFNEVVIRGHYVDLLPPNEPEVDNSELKRVELHLHTKMSAMDAVSTMDDYAKIAKDMGHTAIAVTDHADIQAFPEAQAAGKKYGLKVLYGVELYMFDDNLNAIRNPANIELSKATYVVLDLETTGLSAKYNKIIEFGAVKVENGLVTHSLDILINPECPIPLKIVEITGIDDDQVKNEKPFREVMDQILDFLSGAILVTHNAEFDISFLNESLLREGRPILTNPIVDTLALSRYLFPEAKRHALGALCRNMEVYYNEEEAHRADYDATVLNNVWQPMIVLLNKKHPGLTHAELADFKMPKEIIKNIKTNHVIAFVKDMAGLKDLYKIVSFSNIDYLGNDPKIPKSVLEQYRSHLILGSACFNGEVFSTQRYYNDERLKEVMSFYDYIEIQPKPNYSYLVDMGDLDEDELDEYLRNIVKCADEIGKPVCATGDVHYARRTDKKFRDVFVFAKGLGGVNHPLNPYSRSKKEYFENPDQHYRSTEEMLQEMAFLGEEKAKEIVVDNTNKIADMIESIIPVPNNKLYPPKIENCEEDLKNLCYGTAHKLYGDPLPELIQKRLDTELNGVISHNYSVIYFIAHKLVQKANEDGFIVGSRGSVGSSFVATMAGVTEVNPLPPHYICPHCHHIEWTSETMPEYRSGYDLPEKACPECGTSMIHDGQNIPFETFLGFKADKTPDIDLNFPGDYQATAHEYTKVLLGPNNVFRAGTIETVAEKNAYGYARGFYERYFQLKDHLSEEEAINKAAAIPRSKVEYLASGCLNVKRTTGQHPGGIVVIPNDNEVYDFTPIQYPANDSTSNWRTTHLDYNAMHETLLKLDMLGHVDPVALKMMCTLTGVDLKSIPLNDKRVYSLFSSPEELHMENDYLGSKTGAMALPEFGTELTRKTLEATAPNSFSDLVIISGLSHGTGVWDGNAEVLIRNGTATLQEVIGCRDDIMVYLIGKGLPSDSAFAIMEDVRKGRGLKDSYVELMKAHNVPEYYIDSCRKIQYMFPKGHAVAYVTMAIRVGYFKIYYPLEFYATFFSVRSKQYDIRAMIAGKEAIINKMEEIKMKGRGAGVDKMTTKESDQYKTLAVALEMIQRGYIFANIDLYKSDPINFVVDHERKALIPPFTTIDGLGENNAVTVKEARESDGKFFSKEDLLRRTKLTTSNVKALSDMHVLDDLNDSDQMSLFDF